MPGPHRVLLIGRKDQALDALSLSIERESSRAVVAETTAALSDAISRVTKVGYDAVVCWAEREDELAGVIRIRKTRPDQPILLMTSLRDPRFDEKARQAGATRTAPAQASSAALSEYIRLAVQSGDLGRELLAGARWAHAQAREVRELAERTHALSTKLWRKMASHRKATFVPLLVEDDPGQVLLMVRALQKVDVHAALPVMSSGEDAIAYLSESAPFENLASKVAPTLVLLDIRLPGRSGLEVLEWIRKQPKFNRLPVVMLSASSDRDQMDRAYQRGANSYIIKPMDFNALVSVMAGLKQYWGACNHSEAL